MSLKWGVLNICDPEIHYSIYWFCHSSLRNTAQSQLCKKEKKHKKYLTTQYRQLNHIWRRKQQTKIPGKKYRRENWMICVRVHTHMAKMKKNMTNEMPQNVFRNHNGAADGLLQFCMNWIGWVVLFILYNNKHWML